MINVRYIGEKLFPAFMQNSTYCQACTPLRAYPDSDHGPAFEIAVTVLEWVLGISDLGEAFRLRHLCTFLLFYTSTIFFYLLLQERFRNALISLAGVVMLLVSPRIFAESFYNAKDLPFLSMAIISTFSLIRFLKNPGWRTAFWHAMACGITMDIRILGLIFPAATLFFTLLYFPVYRKAGFSNPKLLTHTLVYLLLFLGFSVLFWPYLWEEPWSSFLKAFERNSNFPWNGHVLFSGAYVRASELPWYYLPVWVFITTPLPFMFLFLTGTAYMVRRVISNQFGIKASPDDRQDVVVAGLLLVPVAAAMVLDLVFYDAWRHFYFIYPWIIYIVTVGFYKLTTTLQFNFIRQDYLRRGLWFAWFVVVAKLVSWMYLNHPYQHIYFSIYHDDRARQNFELDYWGLSYKAGLMYITSTNDRPEIKLFIANSPGYLNSFILPPEHRNRLKYVDSLSEADYFLTEYRWHPQDFSLKNEVYQVKVDEIKILSVFKLDSTATNIEVFNPGLP